MLRVSSVPTSLKISCQNPPMNRPSRSLTIVLGSQCRRKTCLKNNSATYEVEYCVKMAKECVNLVSGLTTTKMQSFPCTEGSPMMNSIEILSHFPSRMGRGCNSPAGWVNSPFFLWQASHSCTYLNTSPLRPSR